MVQRITPETHPEVWAILQPPEASAPSLEQQVRSIRDNLAAASSALYPHTADEALLMADHHLAQAIGCLDEFLGEAE